MAMTEEQRDRQMINRVYGNISIENPNVTRELTEQIYFERKQALKEGLSEEDALERILSKFRKNTVDTNPTESVGQ